MPIKSLKFKSKISSKSKKSFKKLFKKSLYGKKTKTNKQMKSRNRRHMRSQFNKNHKKHKNHKNHKNHHGGFSSSCNLATVNEPGFSVDALGSIAGFSIPESRGAIYRPNCKTDSSQAMTP